MSFSYSYSYDYVETRSPTLKPTWLPTYDPTESCEGSCGGRSGGSCWCDSVCTGTNQGCGGLSSNTTASPFLSLAFATMTSPVICASPITFRLRRLLQRLHRLLQRGWFDEAGQPHSVDQLCSVGGPFGGTIDITHEHVLADG